MSSGPSRQRVSPRGVAPWRRAARRLLLAFVGVLGLSACEESSPETEPASSRVVAVQASEPEHDPLEVFCDVRNTSTAPKLELPAFATDARVPASKGWRWVNLWATWCKPCIEEMPRLLEWETELSQAGVPLDLLFISVDKDAQAVEQFRAEHPDIPQSRRLAEPDALPDWLRDIGMDGGGTIPIQIFVDPDGRVRCIRSGAVKPSDLDTVEHLVAS